MGNENVYDDDTPKFEKRNPEFANSALRYSKLLRKLDKIGKKK